MGYLHQQRLVTHWTYDRSERDNKAVRHPAQVGRRLCVLHLQDPEVCVEMLIQIPRGSFLRCLVSHHLAGVGILGRP